MIKNENLCGKVLTTSKGDVTFNEEGHSENTTPEMDNFLASFPGFTKVEVEKPKTKPKAEATEPKKEVTPTEPKEKPKTKPKTKAKPKAKETPKDKE